MTPQPAVKARLAAAGDDRTRYDDFAIWLHWLAIAACGLGLVAVYHHDSLKNDALWPMLPVARTRRHPERAPSPERAAGASQS